jgi:hypothetical protein
MSHSRGSARKTRTFRQPPDGALLGVRMAQLKQVEGRMDDLFREVLDDCSEQDILDAIESFDRLVSACPELRLTLQVGQHPDEVLWLVSQLDPDHGPLPGYEAAMEQLCELCLTPRAIHGLHSRLYTAVARVAQECPELLPTAAIAALSLNLTRMPRTLFTEMVICVSAIEWLAACGLDDDRSVSLDVGTWLAAEPSKLLLAAVGEERAYYYASIPGVLPFLDQRCVLFDVRRLLSQSEPPPERSAEPSSFLLGELADRPYRRRLRAEIERAQGALRQQHPATCIADVEMLAHRALEALDDLPPQVNPLLQAIWVQSWVQCLHELC